MTLVSDIPLDITMREAEQFHGLQCRGLLQSKSVSHLEDLLEELNSQILFGPKIAYSAVPLQGVVNGRLYLPGQMVLNAPIAAHRLRRASYLLLGACTLGGAVAIRIATLFAEKKRFKALLLEQLANLALFKLSARLQAFADDEARRLGIQASGPLSPGDDGFDLSAQKAMIDLSGARDIGISLSSNYMMSPQHSMTILYGLGQKMDRWSQAQNCENCRSRKNCRHRDLSARMSGSSHA